MNKNHLILIVLVIGATLYNAARANDHHDGPRRHLPGPGSRHQMGRKQHNHPSSHTHTRKSAQGRPIRQGARRARKAIASKVKNVKVEVRKALKNLKGLSEAESKARIKKFASRINNVKITERKAKIEKVISRFDRLAPKQRISFLKALIHNTDSLLHILTTLPNRTPREQHEIIPVILKHVKKHLGGKTFYDHAGKIADKLPQNERVGFLKGLHTVENFSEKHPKRQAPSHVANPGGTPASRAAKTDGSKSRLALKRFKRAIGKVTLRKILRNKIRILRGQKKSFLVFVRGKVGTNIIRVKQKTQGGQAITKLFKFGEKTHSASGLQQGNQYLIESVDEHDKVSKTSTQLNSALEGQLKAIAKTKAPLIYHKLRIENDGSCLNVEAEVEPNCDESRRKIKRICNKADREFIQKALLCHKPRDRFIVRLGVKRIFVSYREGHKKVHKVYNARGPALRAIRLLNRIERFQVKELYRQVRNRLVSKPITRRELRWATFNVRRGNHHYFVVLKLGQHRKKLAFRIRATSDRAAAGVAIFGAIQVGHSIRAQLRGDLIRILSVQNNRIQRKAINLDKLKFGKLLRFFSDERIRLPRALIVKRTHSDCLRVFKKNAKGKKRPLGKICGAARAGFYAKWTSGEQCSNIIIQHKRGGFVVKCTCSQSVHTQPLNADRFQSLATWLGLGFNHQTEKVEELWRWYKKQEGISSNGAISTVPRNPGVAHTILITKIRNERYALWQVVSGEVNSHEFELAGPLKRKFVRNFGKDFEKYNFLRLKRQTRSNGLTTYTLSFPDKTPERSLDDDKRVRNLIRRVIQLSKLNAKYPTSLLIERAGNCFKLFRVGAKLPYKLACGLAEVHKLGAFFGRNKNKVCRKVTFELPWIDIACCHAGKSTGKHSVFGLNYDDIVELRDAPSPPPKGIVIPPARFVEPKARPLPAGLPSVPQPAPGEVTNEPDSPFSIIPAKSPRSFWGARIARTKNFIYFVAHTRVVRFAPNSDIVSRAWDLLGIPPLRVGDYLRFEWIPSQKKVFSVVVAREKQGEIQKKEIRLFTLHRLIRAFLRDGGVYNLRWLVHFERRDKCIVIYDSQNKIKKLNTICGAAAKLVNTLLGNVKSGRAVFTNYAINVFPDGAAQAAIKTSGGFNFRLMSSDLKKTTPKTILRQVGNDLIARKTTKHGRLFYGVLPLYSGLGLKVSKNLLHVNGNTKGVRILRAKNWIRIATRQRDRVILQAYDNGDRVKTLIRLSQNLVEVPFLIKYRRNGGCYNLWRLADGAWVKYRKLCDDDIAKFHPDLHKTQIGTIRLSNSKAVINGWTAEGGVTELRRVLLNKFRVDAIAILEGNQPVKPKVDDAGDNELISLLRKSCLFIKNRGKFLLVATTKNGEGIKVEKGKTLNLAIRRHIKRFSGKKWKLCLVRGKIQASEVVKCD